ncbi:hypothetical protein K523DRAFT_414595 [Schizophyllum commune Tattone D]|nr:hypothetical protein K523DRAFT_414595 [Schizophyllum commune Tattone D]
MVHDITTLEEFTELINNGKPVIINCYVSWSGPCRISSQMFETLVSKSLESNATASILRKTPDIAGGMGAQVMPTFVAYKDGAKIGKVTGPSMASLQQRPGASAGRLA